MNTPLKLNCKGFDYNSQNLTVHHLTDENDGDLSAGDLSLREAILNINPRGTIEFSSNLSGTIVLDSSLGQLEVDKPMKIDGSDANITISANYQFPVFFIDDNDYDNLSEVSIEGLTITEGRSGIVNRENLTVENSTISNNMAAEGGGIENFGNLNLFNSTVSHNVVEEDGAGIWNSGNLRVENSAIIDNTSETEQGGGLYHIGDEMTVLNTTVSGNLAYGAAGILNGGSSTATIINSTIYNNASLADSGGIRNVGKLMMGNSIVAGNTTITDGPDVTGDYTSLGSNLIGNSDGSTGFTDGVNGDIVGTSSHLINPQLRPLAHNGGITKTHGLRSDSPALDQGNDTLASNYGLSTDQRSGSFSRIVDHNVDIGAFELRVTDIDIPLEQENGILANLDTQTFPVFGYKENVKIMPLGDSITAGEHRVDAVPGAYRIQLWNNFQRDDISANFVGSDENGPSSNHFDRDHEGHGGWKISQIKGLVDNNLLINHKPDTVMLMIGTNNILGSGTVDNALNDLDKLLSAMKDKAPGVKVLVSDIPAIDPSGSKGSANSGNAQQAKDFNAGINNIISTVNSPNIIHVEVGSQLDLDDINSDGVHPTAAGYDNLGNAWYDALMNPKPYQLMGIQHLVGSQFNDKLIGNETSNILAGQGGEDWLSGTPATSAGANEQDVLLGGTDADRFILGDAMQAYYMAGGDADFVRLVDFNASEDIAQLHGVSSDYTTVLQGNDIYLKLAHNNELIAIFENQSSLNLSGSSFELI